MPDNESVEEICGRIREDGEKEISSILDKAEKTASEIIAKAEKEKEKIIEKILAQAKEKGLVEQRRELSGVQIEIKRTKLKIREEVITDVMEKVKVLLEDVRSQNDYDAILKDMIIEGIEALDGKSFYVYVDQRDFSLTKEKVIPAVYSELGTDIEDIEVKKLKTESMGGARISVPGGNVIYDNRFEARMYRFRDKIRNLIFERIFRTEGSEGSGSA